MAKKNKIKLTDEERKKYSRDFDDYDKDPDRVTDIVRRDITEAEEYFSNTEKPRYDQYIEAYKNFIDFDKMGANGVARLKIPYAYQQIQTLIPKTTSIIAQKSSFVKFDIVDAFKNSSEKTDMLDRVNTYFEYVLSQKVKFYPKFSEIIEKCYVYGGAITKQEWKSEVTSSMMRNIQKDYYGNSIGLQAKFTEQDRIDDYPDVQIINHMNFRHDPTATSMDNMRYCATKNDYDLAGLNKLYNTGLITAEGYELAFSEATADIQGSVNSEDQKNKKVKPVSIYEYWNIEGYRVFYLSTKTRILGLSKNIYHHKQLPFTIWKFNNEETGIFGVSMIDVLGGLQYENDVARTQRRDNIAMNNNRPLLKPNDIDIEAEDLVAAAGKIIGVDTDDPRKALFQLEVADLGNAPFQESAAIQQDMDNVSGIHDPIRGNFQQKGQQTATAYNVIQGNASERIIERVKFLEADSLTRCFNQLMALCRQFIVTDREYVKYESDPYEEERNIVPVEAFQNLFELIPETSISDPTVTPEIMKQNKLEGLNTLVPLIETGQVNPRGIVEAICKIYELDADKIMITPEQEQMMMQQQEQQQMMAQQQEQLAMEQQMMQMAQQAQQGLAPIEEMGGITSV